MIRWPQSRSKIWIQTAADDTLAKEDMVRDVQRQMAWRMQHKGRSQSHQFQTHSWLILLVIRCASKHQQLVLDVQLFQLLCCAGYRQHMHTLSTAK